VTKDINVQFFIHRFTFKDEHMPANSCTLCLRTPGYKWESGSSCTGCVLFADIKSTETIWVFVPRDGHSCRVPCSHARGRYLSELRRTAKNTRVWWNVWILSLNTQQRTKFFPILNSNLPPISFSRGPTALLGLGFLLVKVSRSHSETPHSVGLHWASDRPVAETSTWQYT